MALFNQADGFAKELAVGQAMANMRQLLTPAVMQPVMELMNTALGFLTDQDPNKPTDRNPHPKPYSVEVVRDVFIESRLRGFHTIGNEFNIISGRFYGAQSGFLRKIREWPGLTNFEDFYDVPRMVQEKGAIVKCWAKWKLGGQEMRVDREFAIRVNAYMGADAIIGKAKRKLYKEVHDRLSGVNTPEGDIEDNDLTNAKPANATTTGVQFDAEPAKTEVPPWSGPGNPNIGTPQAINSAPAEAASPQPAPETPAAAPKLSDMQEQLQNTLQASGIGFEPFRGWLGALQTPPHDGSQWAEMGQVPDSVLKAMLDDQAKVKAFVAWKRANAKRK